MEWWDGGEEGEGDQSDPPLLMVMQGCDNLEIMAVEGCSVYFDGAAVHWFE